MRLLTLLALLLPLSLSAAPPPNDNFAARTSLAGSGMTVLASNIDATVEAAENTQNFYMGSTVWWSWLAPLTGWARVDTGGSSFDTVLQISTGSSLASQTYIGFNVQSPDPTLGFASSVTFQVTAGTTYNIALGGCSFCDFETGEITLRIATGTAVTPAFFPTTLTLTPSSVNVTTAPANVTASFTIQAATGTGTGTAGIGFGWENTGGNGRYTGTPANWNTSLPQSGSPQVPFTVPRYKAPGSKMVWFKVKPAGSSTEIIFSAPNGGSGYALPATVAQALQITNTGAVDEDPPNLTALTITPNNADVTAAPATLQVSATLTDATAGVAWVKVKLLTSTVAFDVSLTRTAGTAQSGTWTGAIAVPLLYPSANYSVLLEAADAAENETDFGEFSLASREIPGGNLDIPIIGGSAYERWAYNTWFQPGNSLTGILDDADQDGRPNLLSYAFDLNPLAIANSPGSLPAVGLTGIGTERHLRIIYLHRKDATNRGLTYSAQFTSSLSGVWETVSGGIETDIGGDWKRITVDDTVGVSGEIRRFGRVKVEYVAP